jgi:hypothetical protein
LRIEGTTYTAWLEQKPPADGALMGSTPDNARSSPGNKVAIKTVVDSRDVSENGIFESRASSAHGSHQVDMALVVDVMVGSAEEPMHES